MLNAQDIAVDELEMDHAKQHRKPRDADIPDLALGEPELDPKTRRESDGDKKVIVESDDMDMDGAHHGEEREEDMSAAEREKHKKFEEMRKRHYEMHDVKNLLGWVVCVTSVLWWEANLTFRHADDLELEDDDGDENDRP